MLSSQDTQALQSEAAVQSFLHFSIAPVRSGPWLFTAAAHYYATVPHSCWFFTHHTTVTEPQGWGHDLQRVTTGGVHSLWMQLLTGFFAVDGLILSRFI